MTNKRILVVGGSSGIGLAVAKQAYSQGARVIIASRNATAKLSGLTEESIEACDVDITSPRGPSGCLRRLIP